MLRRSSWLPPLLALTVIATSCAEEHPKQPADESAAGRAPTPWKDAAAPDGTGGSGPQREDAGSSSGGAVISDASTSEPDATSESDASDAEPPEPMDPFNVLAIAEYDQNHAPFVVAATKWLNKLAADNKVTVKYVETPDTITDAELSKYALILQLNYVPYAWKPSAQAAFQKYITEGKGGWVGLHHAGLYGPVVSSLKWDWFYDFLGKINFKNYIATFAEATVHVEQSTHPIFKGVPATFQVNKDEWYTWDKSPRANVRVLANVDENSYKPPSDVKMGDHPVIWTNEAYKAKNLYIFIGHHPNLFDSEAYKTLLQNAIFWAATPNK